MSVQDKVPVEITLTIQNAHDAIEYWLNEVVFKDAVKVQGVQYNDRDNVFKIIFDRQITSELYPKAPS